MGGRYPGWCCLFHSRLLVSRSIRKWSVLRFSGSTVDTCRFIQKKRHHLLRSDCWTKNLENVSTHYRCDSRENFQELIQIYVATVLSFIRPMPYVPFFHILKWYTFTLNRCTETSLIVNVVYDTQRQLLNLISGILARISEKFNSVGAFK